MNAQHYDVGLALLSCRLKLLTKVMVASLVIYSDLPVQLTNDIRQCTAALIVVTGTQIGYYLNYSSACEVLALTLAEN